MNEKKHSIDAQAALKAFKPIIAMLEDLADESKPREQSVTTPPASPTAQFGSAASDTLAALKGLTIAINRIIQTQRLNQQTKNIFDALKSDAEILTRTLSNSTIDLADTVDQFNKSGIRTTPNERVAGDEWKQE